MLERVLQFDLVFYRLVVPLAKSVDMKKLQTYFVSLLLCKQLNIFKLDYEKCYQN